MPPAYRFSRGGKVFKELDADEGHLVPGFIRTGIIGSNDDYWMTGMTEWKKVFSRDWTATNPAPTATASAAATAAASAAEAAQSAAAASQMPTIGRTHLCECTECKKGFSTPVKAVSGYSVIGKAALFFIIGMVLVFVNAFLYYRWTMPAFFSESRASFLLAFIVCLIVSLAGLGLLLMSVFELISAAVTHGIYRSNPLRCPYCNSSTFTKKI
jgi:hypothetical protein